MKKLILLSAIIFYVLFYSAAYPQKEKSSGNEKKGADSVFTDKSAQLALETAQKSYNDALKSRDKGKEAKALFDIGINFKRLLIYDKASEYLTKSLALFEELNDNKKIAVALLNMGDLYRSIGEFNLAKKYTQRALGIFEKEKNKRGIARSSDRLASIYYETCPGNIKDIDTAFTYVKQAIEIGNTIGDDTLICSSKNILGASYCIVKKYDLAIAELSSALDFAQKKNILEDVPLIKINIAYAYFSLKDYSKAIEYSLSAYKYAAEKKILPYIDMSTLCLYRSNYALGNYKDAYDYLLLYNDNRWRLFEENRMNQIRAVQIKYDTERKEIELENQKRTAFLWTLIFIGLLFAVASIAGLFIYKNLLMKKKNLELEKKNALISEQNEKLTELNATKDKLFSIIGHDLKNPYQSLLGFSNILIQDYQELSEKEIKEFVGYIFEASDMGNRLLQNLLDWSRSETGRIKYEPELFNLKGIIGDSIVLSANTAKQKEITILTDVPDNLTVFCDKNMIYTVIRNLVSNAIKFSYRGGTVKIDSSQSDSIVEIKVSDRGVGMNDILIEDLFKIEKRITKDGTENEKGTGLGLFLCKEFIEKNKGDIKVESTPGVGSSFIFTLPSKPVPY